MAVNITRKGADAQEAPESPAEAPAPAKKKGLSAAELDAQLMAKASKKRTRIATQPHNTTKAAKARNAKKYSAEDLNQILDEGNAPMSEELLEERQAAQEVRESGGRMRATAEAVEYRRKQVLRLVLRGVPKATIAEHLAVPVRQVYEDMVEINRGMREEIQNFDYPVYIGMSCAFYEEARNIALRLATDSKEKSNNTKMAALRIAIAAEDSKHDFLTKVGLFKVAAPTDPFNNIQTGRQGSYSDGNDIQSFLDELTGARQVEGERVDDVVEVAE